MTGVQTCALPIFGMLVASFNQSYSASLKKPVAYATGSTLLRNIRIYKKPNNENVKKRSKVKAYEILPRSYDSRKQAWWNDKKIKIKDQHSSAICWAFAEMTAAEISYLKETGDVEPLSPTHFAYFFFNRENDPLGNTSGDKNTMGTHDPSPWYENGGNVYSSSQALANWMGAVTEEKAPFSMEAKAYDSNIAYDNYITGQNSIIVDATDSYAVKSAVRKYGAVVTSCMSGHSHRHSDGTYNHYYSRKADANHAVTVIGWDDDYPKEKFAAQDGKGKIPAKNGAWIIQNSWGEEYRESRISYEDTSFAYVGTDDEGGDVKSVNALDMQPAESYRYNYQYDGTAGLSNLSLDKGSKIANVYRLGDGARLLEAVGFSTFNDGKTSYSVTVYADLKDETKPESGNKICTFDVATENAGSYTFRLGDYGIKAVNLKKNSVYSIVVTTNGRTYFGVEEDADYGTLKCEAYTDENQSFVKMRADTDWTDLHKNPDKMCARIKGFANDVPTSPMHGGEDDNKSGGDDDSKSGKTDTTQKSDPHAISSAPNVRTDYSVMAGRQRATKKSVKKPAGTSIKRVKVSRKKCILTWKRQTSGIDGYQIQYSINKKFKASKKKNVGKKKTRATIGNLKSKKKYYIRIRTYVKSNGKYSYSKWSKSTAARSEEK